MTAAAADAALGAYLRKLANGIDSEAAADCIPRCECGMRLAEFKDPDGSSGWTCIACDEVEQ